MLGGASHVFQALSGHMSDWRLVQLIQLEPQHSHCSAGIIAVPPQCSRSKPSSWPDASLLFSKSFPSIDLNFLLCKMAVVMAAAAVVVLVVAVVGSEGWDSLTRGSYQLGQCQVPAIGGRWFISHKTNQEWLGGC